MNILLVNVPSRKGEGGFMLPLGLLYVGRIIESLGHKAKIIDLYLRDIASIDKEIESFDPDIVGFGGIASSYGQTKQLSLHIKENHPKIIQIAGGPLASTYELLLTKTKIDAVFHGETEVSLPVFLKAVASGKKYEKVPGISFLSSGKLITNPSTEQIKNLDDVPFPAYHLVDVKQYLVPTQRLLNNFSILFEEAPERYGWVKKRVEGKDHYLDTLTSRGCTNRCFFCYRHVFGYRQHSVRYVMEHIKYAQKKFGISGFSFGDELFNFSPAWVAEFCDAIEKEHLDIFYIVAGARVDKTDENMLRRLKETGCIAIYYGQESGSDIVLRDYRKGVTSQRNREITELTNKLGLLSIVQIVIGSPNETNETINETIQFLKDTNCPLYSLNYLMPLPQTPSWEFAIKNNLIKDHEKYLDEVAEYGGTRLLVNLTKEPDEVVRKWSNKIRSEFNANYYKNKGNPLLQLSYSVFSKIKPLVRDAIPFDTRQRIMRLAGKFGLRL